MSEPAAKRLWTALGELLDQLRAARYWTDRRDACEELRKLWRQAAYHLRVAAEDPDPDVSHWGRQALAQMTTDGRESLAELAPRLDRELKDRLAERGAPSAVEAAGKTSEPPTTPQPVPSPAPPHPVAGPDFGSIDQLLAWLEQFAREQTAKYLPRPGGAQLVIPQPGGRQQTVYADCSQQDAEGKSVAMFYSICGAAEPDAYAWALEANARLARGAFGIIRQGDCNVMVMTQRTRLEDLREDQLRKDLDYLAKSADWGEKKLSASDRH